MKTALLIALLPVFLLSAERVSACYDPGTQRWLNRDPIGETGGVNPYRYVGNNSINKQDAFGECPLASPSAANEWGKGTPQLSTGEALKETGKGLAIGAGIVAGAAGFGALLEATPAVLGWLGLGGAAAESPPGQRAIQRSPEVISRLLQEAKGLERALWEDRVAVDNARNLIARIRNAGGTPNPHCLREDLKSCEKVVCAKEKELQDTRAQLNQLQRGGCQ